MRPVPALLVALFLASTSAADTIVTKCQVEDARVTSGYTARRLIGCGEGFPDNLLWHLDRLDSADGRLDESLTRSSRPGAGAVVYVVDTGVEKDHDEFARPEGTNIIDGIDPAKAIGQVAFACGGRDPSIHPCVQDQPAGLISIFSHGTGVASVV